MPEGVTVGTVLTLHGAKYLCRDEHHRSLGNLRRLEGEVENGDNTVGTVDALAADEHPEQCDEGDNQQEGCQQLEVTASLIKARYNVGIILDKPRFAYRETIKKLVKVQGRYKKQSGGHGQYGDVIMSFEPSGDLEKSYVFEEQVFGGSVPKNYFPAVEKGVQECCEKGPLAGYPVVGIKATLLDGSYHPVDSSEMAFKTAASMAFKDAFMQAQPILLEPIASLKVTVPDANTGDIMGDLTKRRGRIMGMNAIGNGKQLIEAEIPMSNLYGYNTDLRSMTGGSGDFEYSFNRYEQAPGDIQNQIVAENQASQQDS
jgi:elongation factor G